MAKTPQNPTLQQFSSKRNRTMKLLTECAAHGDQVMTGHDRRRAGNFIGVHRVRMITDVDDRRPLSESLPQLSWKQDELVDISEPFADEIVRAEKFSKDWIRGSDFCRNSCRHQSLQHHESESLHASLTIERVITDQQNHWCDRCQPRAHECDRRKRNGAAI